MIPPELQHIVDSAIKQGCTVISAVLEPGDQMPYRATIVVEKNGKRVLNSGQGFVRAGRFSFEIRYSGPVVTP